MKKFSFINLFFLITYGKDFFIFTLFTLFIVSGSIFTIVPETQYVYVNDTVTFECAINVTGYAHSLSFVTYPPVMHSVSYSTEIASLNLTATSEVNGTNVTCNASNLATTEPAYVYVQGQYNTFIYSKYYYFLPDGQL